MDPPVRFDISISHWPEYNNVAMVFSPQIDWIATEQEHVQNAFMIKIPNSQERRGSSTAQNEECPFLRRN